MRIPITSVTGAAPGMGAVQKNMRGEPAMADSRSVISWGRVLGPFLLLALVTGLWPSRGQAQACAGTTVSATGSSMVINCADGETVISGSRLGPNNPDSIAATIDGAGLVRISTSEIIGWLDFSGLNGALDIELQEDSRAIFFSGGGVTDGAVSTHLGNGDVSLRIAEGARLSGYGQSLASSTAHLSNGLHSQGVDLPVVVDFGEGTNIVRNNGFVVVGYKSVSASPPRFDVARADAQGELHLENLTAFENAGLIRLGSADRDRIEDNFSPIGEPYGDNRSDYWHDDLLLMPGADFVGLSGSRIELDVNLNGGVAQTACDPGLRLPGAQSGSSTGADMPSADCVGLQGGSTSGETALLIRNVFADDRGGSLRTVLIDVNGGESADGHFVLDPASDNYSARYGGVLDKGMFIYALDYDADEQRHLLVGLPGPNAWQMPLLTEAANELWRTSTANWLQRQAELRASGAVGADTGGGVWLRVGRDTGDRDALQSGASGPAFDNSYRQNNQAFNLGFDLVASGDQDRAWLVGFTAGYANARLRFDDSPNAHQFDGFTGGLYASWISEGLFVDGILNLNDLSSRSDMPALELDNGALSSTDVSTLGLHIDAGWRLPLSTRFWVEPLAGISWVRTRWDDLDIVSGDPLADGVIVAFEDTTSRRLGAGMRTGLDHPMGSWRVQYTLQARLWRESDGNSDVTLHSTGPDAMVQDALDGTFTELGAGVGVHSGSERVSGFLNIGTRFGDDLQATTASAGVRVAW